MFALVVAATGVVAATVVAATVVVAVRVFHFISFHCVALRFVSITSFVFASTCVFVCLRGWGGLVVRDEAEDNFVYHFIMSFS